MIGLHELEYKKVLICPYCLNDFDPSIKSLCCGENHIQEIYINDLWGIYTDDSCNYYNEEMQAIDQVDFEDMQGCEQYHTSKED